MSKIIVMCSLCHKEEVIDTIKTDITDSILTICPDCQQQMTDRNLKGWQFSISPKNSRKKMLKKRNHSIDKKTEPLKEESKKKNSTKTESKDNKSLKSQKNSEQIEHIKSEKSIEMESKEDNKKVGKHTLFYNGKSLTEEEFKDFQGSNILSILPFSKDYEEAYDYTIYTYGESNSETSIGAYGYLIIRHDTKGLSKFAQGFFNTTNNRMELLAVTQALYKLPDQTNVAVVTSSEYVSKIINGEWEEKSNKPIWADLYAETQKKNIEFTYMKYYKKDYKNEVYSRSSLMEMAHDLCIKEMERVKNENLGEKDMDFNPGQFNNISKTSSRAMQIKIFLDKSIDYKDRTVNIIDFYEEIGINKSCAEAISKFNKKKKHTFLDYKNIKTYGNDDVSDYRMEFFEKYYPKAVISIVKRYLRSLKAQEAALRWHYRGLRIEDSIRKVLVDIEINESLKEKQLKAASGD